MSERVRITDVSPRDGLQNEPGVIAAAQKCRLVELLWATGVDEIEITSFVSPKWVPQLGDAAEVCRGVSGLAGVSGRNELKATREEVVGEGPVLSALVPNAKGLASLREVEAGLRARLIDKISVFTSASETFSKKNTNASIAETIERFRELLSMDRAGGGGGAGGGGVLVRGYVSCVVACPFEGPVSPGAVADVCEQLVALGIDELDLGDTIGAAAPESIVAMLDAVTRRLGHRWLERRAITVHLHDTFGRAAECVKASLDRGVRSFDGSVAGLGGCPYASTPGRRAPGNIDTRLLVETIHRAGYSTGVNLDRLDEAASYAREIVAGSRLQVGAGAGAGVEAKGES